MDGIIGKKIGMTQIFNADGTTDAVTAIEAGPCTVTQVKTVERDGYNAVQVGFGIAKRLNEPEKGHLKDLGLFRYLREFRTDNPSALAVGQIIDVGLFKDGDKVSVTGVSKGRGFAGVVKRYHFAGGPKTHGQSDRHRAAGSIGATTTPGRVIRGLKMAGHMGHRRITVNDLKVMGADPNRNLLLIKGAVPGPKNGLLIIKKSTRQGAR